MKILLTNDDGVSSEGIKKLASLLRSRGKHRVFVIAPDTNRSGVSHALSILNGPVKLSDIEEDTWSCSGNPADCVIVGLKGALPEWPDIVLSGINRGANTGQDIIYSGTAAGARQGSLSGLPSVALSLDGWDPYYWDMAASWSVDHLEELLPFWEKNSFVNVNIPNGADFPKGMAPAWPALKTYRDKLSVMSAPDGSRWCFLGPGEESTLPENGSDCELVSRGLVSVSTVYNYPVVLKDLCPGAPNYASVARRE